MGLFDDSTLFGILTPPEEAVSHMPQTFCYFMDKKETTQVGSKITVFKGDLNTVLDFLTVSSQFLIALNSLQQPYALLGTNSNSFAYSLLKHGLGHGFDESAAKAQLKDLNWVVPGYDNFLLPDARFIHFTPPPPGLSMEQALKDVIIYQKTTPRNVCDPMEELKIQGLFLAQAILSPFVELFDVIEKPTVYQFEKDARSGTPRFHYYGRPRATPSLLTNRCPPNAFKPFPS
jgi:hypothetical protein